MQAGMPACAGATAPFRRLPLLPLTRCCRPCLVLAVHAARLHRLCLLPRRHAWLRGESVLRAALPAGCAPLLAVGKRRGHASLQRCRCAAHGSFP